MTWIEYAVIVAYLFFLLGVGWVFKRFNKNTSDYLRGGCKGTWWLVGSSAFMSVFSAWTFTGAAGVVFESGLSVMIIYLGNTAGFFINFLFVGAWLRQLRATTAPEVIRMRFGPGTQKLYAFSLVPIRLLYSGLQLYGLAIFCSAVFGYDIVQVIVAVGVVVLFYSASGGRWAVMATDFLQGLILVPLTILVAFLCLRELGGVEGLFRSIEVQGLASDFRMINSWEAFAGSFTWGWASAMVTKQILRYNTLELAPRYFSVKDSREARKAALLAMFLMLGGAVFWLVPPMTARLLFAPEVALVNIANPAEASYAVASLQLLPSGLTGLVIVAILTATMSSMDTGLNENSAIILRDITPSYCRWRNIELPKESSQLKHARIITIILGILIIALAVNFSQQKEKGIFEIMIDLGALVQTPMMIPLFWGMFIRKTPPWVAIFSVACAFVASALSFFSGDLFATEWTFQTKFFSVFLTGSIAFFIAIPCTRELTQERAEQVAEFFRRLHTPIDFEMEVGTGNDSRQLKMLGLLGLFIAGFIGLMMLLPNPAEGRVVILILTGIIGAISALMLWVSTRQSKPITQEE